MFGRNLIFAGIALVFVIFTCGLIVAFILADESDNDNEAEVITATFNVAPTSTRFPTAMAATVPAAVAPQSLVTQVIVTQAIVVVTQPVLAANCTVRSDWALYTIAAGDTLGIIADTIGTTVDDLVAGNCLLNPDSILVGQQLLVPSLPSGAVTTGNTISTTASVLIIQPNISFVNNLYTLQTNGNVVITWQNLPVNIIAVDFLWTPPNATAPTLLVRDSNMNDGASASWVVPAGASGAIGATAFLSDGSQVPSSPINIIAQ